jgi:hypothetical protein
MPTTTAQPQSDGALRTLKARRVRRFQYFQLEILKRLGGNPPFTDEERQQLALQIWPGGGGR